MTSKTYWNKPELYWKIETLQCKESWVRYCVPGALWIYTSLEIHFRMHLSKQVSRNWNVRICLGIGICTWLHMKICLLVWYLKFLVFAKFRVPTYSIGKWRSTRSSIQIATWWRLKQKRNTPTLQSKVNLGKDDESKKILVETTRIPYWKQWHYGYPWNTRTCLRRHTRTWRAYRQSCACTKSL